MKKDVKLYDSIWLPNFLIVLLQPMLVAVVLVGNLLIDSVVMLVISLIIYKKVNGDFFWHSIWKVWGFGLLGDLAGELFFLARFLFIGGGDSGLWNRILDAWGDAMVLHGRNALGYVFAGIAVLIAAAVIFLLNRFVTFKNTDLTNKQKTLSALAIAVLTAPYTFFIPSIAG